MSTHDHFKALADVYVLGGLGAAEQAEVEEHAAACGVCGRILGEAKAFVSRISSAVAPDAPPEDLEERILDHLRGSETEGGLERYRPAIYRFAKWAGAVAALLLLIFLGDSFPAFSGIGSDERCDACIVGPQWPPKICPPEIEKDDVMPRPSIAYDRDDALELLGEGGGRGGYCGGREVSVGAAGNNMVRRVGLASFLENRKIIHNARVELEVDSCEAAQKKITEIVMAAKGFTAGNDHQRLPNGKMQATITLRVPPERFESVLEQVRALGNVRRQTLSTQDVTKTWVDLEARLSTKEALLERLKKVLAEAKGTVKELMEAEAQMGRTIEEIESVKGELKYYENLVALATITLEIAEKDLGQPFEYVQTLQATIGLTVPDADAATAKGQKVVLDAGGQVMDSKMVRKSEGMATGTLRGRVDADKFPEVREKIKALGHVTADAIERRRTARGGTSEDSAGNAPIRKEQAVIDLTVATPAIAVTRMADFHVEAPEVEKVYLAVRQVVTDAGGRIIEGSLTGNGGYARADIKARVRTEKFADLSSWIKAQGKILTDQVKHQLPSDANERREPFIQEEATIALIITQPAPVRQEESVFWQEVRDTVSNSLTSLTWSIEKLFVGICLAAPWVALGALGWILYRLYRRRKAAKAVAPSPTVPSAGSP